MSFRSPLDERIRGAAVFDRQHVLGIAFDLDAEQANIRAAGEAVERSGLLADPTDVRIASAAQLGDAGLDLRSAATLNDPRRVRPIRSASAWDPHRTMPWCLATEAVTGGPIHVPAELCYFGTQRMDNQRIIPVSSGGTACAPTAERALAAALLELIERHSVARMVASGPAAAVEIPSSVVRWDEMLTAASLRLDVGVVDSTVGVAVGAACVSSDDGSRPAAAFGTSAAESADEAILGATLEAVQVFHFSWQLMRRRRPPRLIRTTQDRSLWWAYHGTRERRAEYISPIGVPVDAPVAKGDLARRVARLSPLAYLDITPEWAVGEVHVIRAVAPALFQVWPDRRTGLIADEFTSASFERLRRRRSPHPFT